MLVLSKNVHYRNIFSSSIMRRSILIAISASSLLLAACVDTTGLSDKSARTPAGNPSAAVIVQEFADLQCPACKASYETINKPLMEKYGSQIRFEFKHFPLTTLHAHALEAAQGAECAADQGKFWEFVDMDFSNQAELNSSAIRGWAKELGLDEALFDRCVRSGIKKNLIMAEEAEGEQKGVRGTPSYFVNGVKVEKTTLDAISADIERALQSQQSMPL